MDLVVLEQHFCHARRFRVVVALAGIQRAQRVHLVLCECKVEDIEVARDPLRVGGLGQDDQPVLYLKAQDDLPGVLAVLLRQPGDGRVGEQAGVAVPSG